MEAAIRNNPELSIVSLGTPARNLLGKVMGITSIFNESVEHPAAASYNNRDWECQNIFNRINMYIATYNKELIKW